MTVHLVSGGSSSGSSGTYWGAPVATKAALNALTGMSAGEARVVIADESLAVSALAIYGYTGSGWQLAAGGGGDSGGADFIDHHARRHVGLWRNACLEWNALQYRGALMPQVPVDLTGIAVGQTLIWDGAKFIKGSRTAGSAPRTATTIAGLGPGAFDGEQALLRVGTYPNVAEEPLSWSDAENRWFGNEHVLITQGDTWSMDLGNRSAAQRLDWSPIDFACPWGHANGRLTSAVDLAATNFNPGTATGVLTVDDTTDTLNHSFPFSDASSGSGTTGAYLRIRDCYLTHTGKTATTLTGVACVQGTRESIPAGERVKQGFPAGWGFSAVALAFADQLATAGLLPQERLMSLCNNGVGASDAEKQLEMAPYWYQYDPGDGTALPSIPPTGGMGVSAILAALPDTAGVLDTAERPFFMTSNGWTNWPLAAPTKHFLIPRMVGRGASGMILSGEVLDTRLAIRFASAVL